ncbi:MAG: gamma-glutamylcyclotransferase [Defluviicoccus sp.]|nr:gamma-glutamylcyclotransferase [Defluviicoccus sp.]MDE0383759.1 gamma-glutamylcyclotransferase [Defluviicoccus sp.]
MTAKIVFDGPGDIWFFAYGSLMWDPGFAFAEARPAMLRGYHRRFCVDSTVYRGTPERPGLVLGLDAGGSCRGLAYRIAKCRREQASRYLDRRELAEDIYLLRRVRLETAEGRLLGYTLVVDRGTPYYARDLAPGEAVRRIATCRGERGTNADYLKDTIARLEAIGVRDGGLVALSRRVAAFAARGADAG